MTPSDDTCRWLAHRVIVDGNEYTLAVLTVTHTSDGWHVAVKKFDRETHSTAFHSGTIRVTTHKDLLEKPVLEFF